MFSISFAEEGDAMGLLGFLSGKKNDSGKSDRKSRFSNDIEQEMYEKNQHGYRDMKDSLDYQDALLSRVNAAQKKFREDGCLDAVIKELEYAFITSNPPCKTSQNMDLAGYYIRAGQSDKAWGYLNRLIMTGQAPLEKIRFEQARILKKEKKWADAIEMYMLGYLAKNQWNRQFQEDMFIKDIRSSASRLGWDDSVMKQLAEIVSSFVRKGKSDEKLMIREYRKLYEKLPHQASG